MNAAFDCIWYDQCGSECQGKCEYYSPADTAMEDETFYMEVLKENAQEYEKSIQNNQIPIMNNIIDLVSKTPQIIRSTCTGTFIFKLLFQSSTVFSIQPISLPSEKS